MAKYPDTLNKFPATPNKYPATPKAYPGTINVYPGGATPLTIFGAASVLQWCRSDVVVVSGGNVTQWTDQSGNGRHYVPGAAGPTYTASDASLGGLPTINFARASSQYLVAAGLSLPAPSTTPSWMGAVCRYRTWTLNAYMFSSDSAAGLGVRHGPTATPNVRLINSSGGTANTGMVVNTWGICEAQWANSASTVVGTNDTDAARTGDYLRLLGTVTDGVNTGGAHVATGRRIGGSTTFADMDVAEIVYLNRKPTVADIVAWNSYLGAI